MSAVLEPAGSGVAGTQTQGVVKQYQLSGTGSSASTLETITPGDGSSDGASGATILGTVPPGKAGLPQVDTTVQRASQLLADSTVAPGNAITPNYSSLNTDPVPPTGSLPADGLSQAPNRE